MPSSSNSNNGHKRKADEITADEDGQAVRRQQGLGPAMTPPNPSPTSMNNGGLIAVPAGSGNAPPTQSPVHNGPMSSAVVVPPRPRPGRKPIPHIDASDRRRTQNRLAQRNFRDKRQQKLADIQVELAETKERHRKEMNDKEFQLDQANKDNQALRRRVEAAEARAKDFESQLFGNPYHHHQQQPQPPRLQQPHIMPLRPQGTTAVAAAPAPLTMSDNGASLPPISSLSQFLPTGANQPRSSITATMSPSVPTPPEEQEIDFTRTWRPLGPAAALPAAAAAAPPRPAFGGSMRDDDKCGFCTDDGYCACKDGGLADEAVKSGPEDEQQAAEALRSLSRHE